MVSSSKGTLQLGGERKRGSFFRIILLFFRFIPPKKRKKIGSLFVRSNLGVTKKVEKKCELQLMSVFCESK